ncbi:helix-turn-helix domain-containing protein [Amycolatopsis magusensis]|uniref:helix-turn-helix domain-containing protein n=1 Tax=Amycolatopsis magusensis TaxID=882444 RepID=UPI003C2B2A0A
MTIVRTWTGREAKVLRAAMRSSVRDFAARLGVGTRTVSKWEARGAGIQPTPEMQAVLDTALAQAAADVQARFCQLLDEVPAEYLRRRTLVKWGLVATASVTAGVGAGRLGAADVARIDRATARLCGLDHRHGGETLWRAGVNWAQEACLMLERGSYGGAVGDQFLVATGNLQIRTGWLACDAGQHDVAQASFADALAVARQAADAEIETRALAGLGFHSNLLGRPREGLRYAKAAAAAKTPRAKAASLLSVAVAGARSGDAAEAEGAIAGARRALDADRGDPAAEWATFLSPLEIDAVEATCAVETGDPARAERLFERAIAGYGDGFARNVALYRVRLAQARVRAGAVDGAVEAAEAALDADVESRRVDTELGRVRQEIARHPRAPGVERFLARTKEFSALPT